jgi:hypothetical protein
MSHEDLSSAMALMIPIIAVSVSFGALIVWIVLAHKRRMHGVECRHKERMAAIEKGMDLPPEPPQPEQVPLLSRYLLRGLIWLGIGLALAVGARDWLQDSMGGAGWIPIAVGAAYLIFYLVQTVRTSLTGRNESESGGERTP